MSEANAPKETSKNQFPVSGIFLAGGILDNKRLLNRNDLFNFTVTFSLADLEFLSARKIPLTGNQP